MLLQLWLLLREYEQLLVVTNDTTARVKMKGVYTL